MMLKQKTHNKELREKAKGFENKMTYEEMRMAGKRIQELEEQEDYTGATGLQSFYRTQRGAMGTSLGMQGCLNAGTSFGYAARVRDLGGGASRHRLNSAGLGSGRRSQGSSGRFRG